MRVAPFLVVCRFVERVKYTGMKKTLRVFLLFAALLSWGAISQVQGAPFSGGNSSKSSPSRLVQRPPIPTWTWCYFTCRVIEGKGTYL